MKKTLLLFFLLFVVVHAGAQTTNIKKAQTNFDKAQNYLKQDNYDLAASALLEAVKEDPSFQFAFIQLGDINRRKKNFEAAKAAYVSAFNIGAGNADPRLFYGL